jgi:hypothetical protein
MQIKYINENYENKHIEMENNLQAKLALRDSFSKRRTTVEQLFKLKNYIKSLPLLKRILAIWIIEPWFYNTMKNIPNRLSKDGEFGYPWCSLKGEL